MRREAPTWQGGFVGRFGVLTDDGDRAQCHICGRWFNNLGAHVNPKHGMSADAYRRAFGLTQSTGLVGPTYQAKRRELGAPVLARYQDRHAQQLRELTAQQRQARLDKARRRVGYEYKISGPDRPRRALTARFGRPDGYGQAFWAQVAADFVDELPRGRGVYARLAKRWATSDITAQARVRRARKLQMLRWTGQAFRPAGELTDKARQLLRTE